MSSAELLLVRVDAGQGIGTGHLMRCLALAEGWQDVGGTCCFAMAESVSGTEERLRERGMERVTIDAPPGSSRDVDLTAELCRERRPAWVVLDGYRFDAAFQERIKATGQRLLAIDDYGHAVAYAADLILNQNLSARPDLYPGRREGSRLLLGTRYVLLGHAFRARRPRVRTGPANRVLVTLGGVDPHNVTEMILRAIARMKRTEVHVRAVVGPGNPHAERLETAFAEARNRIELVQNPPDLAELMEWADLAIAASGTTAWELAYLGVPSLLLSTADNQRDVAASLAREGAAQDLGTHVELTEARVAHALEVLLDSPEEREAMSRRARKLVDGQGVPRVLLEMRAAMLVLRPVAESDARTVWEWANDPVVRGASFSPDPIPWDRHVAWFAAKRGDPACRFYIGLDPDRVPLGQIRFDGRGPDVEVSVSLDPKFRSRGYGSALILAASRKVLDDDRVQRLHAYVKPGNEPSVRAFLKAGYRDAGRQTVRGHEALHFVLERGVA